MRSTLFLTLSASVLLISCSTTKYVDREKSVVDSSATEQNKLLQITLAQTIEQYEKQLRDSSGVRIEYATDTVTIAGQTVYLPGKVRIDKTGAIEAEGRLSSVQVSNSRLQQEKNILRHTVDSLTLAVATKKVEVHTKTVTVEKKVKRGWPWLWFVIGLVAGWVARLYYPRTLRFIKNIRWK